MIVIVANELDPHADAVILSLRNAGFSDFFRIDLETVHERSKITIHPLSGEMAIESNGGRLSLDSKQVKTVWWRRAGNFSNTGELDFPPLENIDKIETYWAVRWFLEAQPVDKFPFGHPAQMFQASNKILQLRLAYQLGFSTPSTLFTNCIDSLKEFGTNRGELVLKPLRTSIAFSETDNKKINFIARPVKSDRLVHLAENRESIATFCQSRVQKVSDIRVNVLPKSVVACEIAMGELPPNEVDWRPETTKYSHKSIDVPSEIEKLCRLFLTRLNLTWGVFDFGALANGNWTFFECNPNGQWLWIEFKTGVRLSEMFARELLEHHSRK